MSEAEQLRDWAKRLYGEVVEIRKETNKLEKLIEQRKKEHEKFLEKYRRFLKETE